jgi:hypothetical protein
LLLRADLLGDLVFNGLDFCCNVTEALVNVLADSGDCMTYHSDAAAEGDRYTVSIHFLPLFWANLSLLWLL